MEKLWPQRSRCKNCRKGLGDMVLKGLYCSYSCAHARPPSSKVSNAPRGCRKQRGDKWEFKTRYRGVAEVPEHLQNDPGTNIYECDNCLCFHVGHSRPVEFSREKLNRIVSSPQTLGSVLRRMREDARITESALARYIKSPVAEVRKIEDGKQNINSVVLLRMISALKAQLILREK